MGLKLYTYWRNKLYAQIQLETALYCVAYSNTGVAYSNTGVAYSILVLTILVLVLLILMLPILILCCYCIGVGVGPIIL